MPTRRKKISALATLALIAGGVAWVATRTPILGEGPVVIGALGALLAVLALLGSMLIGNTGRLLPLIALAACVSAAAYGIVVNGHATPISEQFSHLMGLLRPAVAPPAPPPAAAPAPPPPVKPPAAPPEDDNSVGSGTIFDSSPGASHSSPVPRAPTTPSPLPAITPPRVTDQAQLLSQAVAAVTRAHAKVDAATAGMLPALSQTPAYQSAKTEMDAAAAALKAARAEVDPGNPGLVDASQRYLDAKSALTKIVNQAAATDPNVVAANRELIEAEGNLQAIRAQQSTPATSGGKAH